MVRKQPKKIFIQIGINDLSQGIPRDTVLRKYQLLLQSLKNASPSSKIYIQSLLPVANQSATMPTYCSPEMNLTVTEVNKQLQDICLHHDCTYINLHSRFVTNGHINPAYVESDGVHPSAAGYKIWADILKLYVQE